MERWAVAYSGAVTFVCVSCAGPALAAEFGSTLGLRTCVNTWADEDEMPSWGQLGCNGLIVLDGAGAVVCKSSPAYLEVRTRAFEYVETLLAGLLAAAPAAAPSPGSAVRLVRLVSRAELNGSEAVVASAAGGGGRCIVTLPGGQALSVKLANLEALSPDSEGGVRRAGEDPPPAASCAGGKCALPKRRADGGGARGKKGKAEDAGGGRPAGRVSVASVKVAAMDEEHAQCAAALERLGAERSAAAASFLLSLYEAHFAHEEALLDAHVYKGAAQAPAGFSADAGARRSHLADHARLLDGVRALVAAGPMIEAEAVQRVASDFEAHAEQYDGGYAARLSASLAQAAA